MFFLQTKPELSILFSWIAVWLPFFFVARNPSAQEWAARTAERMVAYEKARPSYRCDRALDLVATCPLPSTGEHMALVPERAHFITNIDWIISSQTDWPYPITLVRLWMREYSPYVWAAGLERLKCTHTQRHTQTYSGLALLGTGTRGWQGTKGAWERKRNVF